jgi:uncharacterized membrane protein YGL010W
MNTPDIEILKPYVPAGIPTNFAFIGTIVYFLFYLFVELPGIVGPTCALIVLGFFKAAIHIHNIVPNCGKIALVVHIIAWIAQFLGHGAFEGRAPALLDNLFQAIFMAPIFITMELFFYLGYKAKFQAEIEVLVLENIKQFKASKKQK